MTSLVDLPDDVFLEIFSYLASSKRDLIRISTLSRRLSILSRGHIYRHIHLLVVPNSTTAPESRRKVGRGIPRTGNPEPDQRCFPLFFRSISNNPSLAPLVRSLRLEWKPCSTGDESTYIAINALLIRLPNIIQLEFFADGYPGNGYGSFTPTFLDVNPMRRLRTIEFDVFFLSSTALAQLMLLPTVESVTVTRFRDASKPAVVPGSKLADFTASPLVFPSRLRHLNLGIFRISLPVLRNILKFAPHLRRLAAMLPGRGNPDDFRASLGDRRLCPSRIAHALEPVRDSLQELSLINDRHEWAGSDGTRADFSAFKKLKKMRVAPGLWFSWGAYAQAVSPKVNQGFSWCKEVREGVWKMLPRSLEELEVFFQFDSGLFCVGHYFLKIFEELPSLPSPAYLWIQELATYKSVYFPKLHTVKLIEQLSTGNSFSEGISFEELRWTPPRELVDAFKAADVELNVTLRSNDRKEEKQLLPCCVVAHAYGRRCCGD